jgi:hypothetical protein
LIFSIPLRNACQYCEANYVPASINLDGDTGTPPT